MQCVVEELVVRASVLCYVETTVQERPEGGLWMVFESTIHQSSEIRITFRLP